MKLGIGTALPLGRRRPLSADRSTAERIRMVLETRPGTLPFRPEFGCALDDVVGEMATKDNVRKAKQAVSDALSRWLPDLEVVDVTVRVVPTGVRYEDLRYPEVPTAERALLSLGTQADLEIAIEIRTQGVGTVVRTSLSL